MTASHDQHRETLRVRRQQLTLNEMILRQDAERLKGTNDAAALHLLMQRLLDHHNEMEAYVTAVEALATTVRAIP